jgi:hypothetical protein
MHFDVVWPFPQMKLANYQNQQIQTSQGGATSKFPVQAILTV